MIYSTNFPHHCTIYLSVGLYIHFTFKVVSRDVRQRKLVLLRHTKCVDIGKVKLDYNTHEFPDEQCFQWSYLEDAVRGIEQDPLVIHCRHHPFVPSSARDDLLEIAEAQLPKNHKACLHSFCGNILDVHHWRNAFQQVHFSLGEKHPSSDVLVQILLDRVIDEHLMSRVMPFTSVNFQHLWVTVCVN